MRDRQVKVTLTAQVAGYVKGMEQAAAYSTYVGTEAEQAAKKLEAQRQAFEQLGRGLLVYGAVAAAGLAIAVKKFAEFDQAMSNVKAVSQETSENMLLLRDAALEAGGRTVYTATEAANAVEELGKAGLTTADILSGALDGALDLAASGQLGVARAAEITATTLKQFNLAGDQASRVADVLSAGAGKALGSVEDLAQGMKFVGPVAASMGISLEETVAVLSLFADQGLVGEQAGTSLRGMLSSLTSPSSIAAKEIKNLGVQLYDANGRFLGMENAAGQLATAYKGLDDQTRDNSLGLIFGNQQITAARVLYQQGAGAVREYTDAVHDSGYAMRVANDRMDNLAGDVEKLGGAFDTALIKTGATANDSLRALVQSVTFLVDGFAELPKPVQEATFVIGGAVTVMALAGGAAMVAIPKFAAFKTNLTTLSLTMGGVATKATLVGGAIALATSLIGAFITAAAESKGRTDAFADSLDRATGSVTDYTRELVAKRLQEQGAFDTASKLGISQKLLTDAVMGSAEAFAEVQRLMEANGGLERDYVMGASGLITVQQTLTKQMNDTTGELENGKDAWENIKAAGSVAESQTKDNERALAALQGRAVTTDDAIAELAAQIRGFGSATLSTRDAQRQFEAALDDAQESLKDNGKTLDINTEKGRANESSLDAIAKAALEAAASIHEETLSQELATGAVQRGRDELILMLAQYGITGAEAEAYADKLGLIPANIGTIVDLNSTAAEAALARMKRAIGELGNARIFVGTGGVALNESGGFYDKGVRAFQNGGFPSGIYPGRAGGIHKFAEENLPWETYISPKPGMERENIGYALESLRRLGYQGSTGKEASASSGPTRIEGTLDLGNGLTGVIRGVISDEVGRALPNQFGGK